MKKYTPVAVFFAATLFCSNSIGKVDAPAQESITPACASALIKANHYVVNEVTKIFTTHITANRPISVHTQLNMGDKFQSAATPLLDDIARVCPKSVVRELRDGLPL